MFIYNLYNPNPPLQVPPGDDPEEKGPVPSYQFDQAELDRAANALDLILQDHDWQPGENWFDGGELIAKLREKGITLALVRAMFAELIIEGVFTRLVDNDGSECLITTTKAATSEKSGRGLFQTWHGYLAARRRASEQGDKVPDSGMSSEESGQQDRIWAQLLTSQPMSAAKIAEIIGQPKPLVERVLQHQRKVRPFCFVLDDCPQKGDARYLHKMAEVIPALKKWVEKRLKKQSGANN